MKHETKPTDIGTNRTGIATAPARAREMTEGLRPSPLAGDPSGLAEWREELSREAPPVGTMPPPATLEGAARAALKMLQGEKANVFLDKLGERLAFERTGVRLYEGLIAKCAGAKLDEGTMTVEEVRRFRDEELAHMHLVREAIEHMGADPTAVTPSANVAGVKGTGLVQVVSDPRTTLTHALEAILIAELADNDEWRQLAALAEALGQDDLAQRFARAVAEEDEHLRHVRRWIAERIELQVGAKLPSLRLDAPSQPV